MSIESVVSGVCLCGNRVMAGAEMHGRLTDDGEFWGCARCGGIEGSPLWGRRTCAQCSGSLALWDERTCPRCGLEPRLEWGIAYN